MCKKKSPKSRFVTYRLLILEIFISFLYIVKPQEKGLKRLQVFSTTHARRLLDLNYNLKDGVFKVAEIFQYYAVS